MAMLLQKEHVSTDIILPLFLTTYLVWVDEEESFYCHLDECAFAQGNPRLWIMLSIWHHLR